MKDSSKQTIFVNAIIHNAKQQVLVVRRSSEDRFLPGYLELPGGRVAPGESLEHALKRKLTHELAIEANTPLYFCSIAKKDRHGPYVRAAFEVAYNQQTNITLSGAHNEYVWVDTSEILHHKMTQDTQTIITQYLGDQKEQNNDDNITTFTVYTDGGSRGNPGPSAAAYVIYNQQNEILESGGSYIGITSNNQAEYTAVLLGLKAIKAYADTHDTISFNIDSLLVVNQMNGLYKIKNRELWPINQQIRENMKSFGHVVFRHVPRENNTVADAKVNEILDAQAS